MLFENYSHSSFSGHPNIIGHIFKKQGKEQVMYSSDYTINRNENEDENEKQITYI